ncbi:hypothetical protein [Amycolatopsis magusensis]|uniref:hypothetical protein n=1 Tax=Amycolatopsis magusensis TaxID=882444 RepID=UPI0024A86EA1|nr:hypothetical protein [Amycolatopsis magusensis]MDI5975930.1 hypothetical protein [Amycolatopsis magusensis]
MSETPVVTEEHVATASRPSDLRITDLRVANVAGVPFRSSIIRIDTNQGLVGYGKVRDQAGATYALMLKSRLVGENPCNVDKIVRKIKQFGFHGRQGGGVSGVEMASRSLRRAPTTWRPLSTSSAPSPATTSRSPPTTSATSPSTPASGSAARWNRSHWRGSRT